MRAHYLVGMAATAAISSAAVAELTLDFENFIAPGANYFPQNIANDQLVPLEGNITGFIGDFVLNEDGEGFTWADDLSVVVATADLSEILIQMGGYSDFGATYRFIWPDGASGDAGTEAGGAVSTGVLGGIDVTGYYLWLGNGYASGGNGNWTGSITIEGTVTPAPGALALLGLAGLAGRRRRG